MNENERIRMQSDYINTMIKNMPVLRTSANLTQAQLADKIGVSRQTIVAIETRKRPLPWSLYLAVVLIFQQYDETEMLLKSFNLFDSVFIRENL